MKRFYPLIFVLFAFATTAFVPSDTIPSREVKVRDLYSMMIPNHMKQDTSLNDEASLEYADPTEELYVIVIDESAKDFVDVFTENGEYDKSKSVIENYALVQKKSIDENMTSISSSTALSYAKVNGLKSYTYQLSGIVPGVDDEILYKVRFFQGAETLYMVMTWTLTTKQKENLPEMNWMLGSFREL